MAPREPSGRHAVLAAAPNEMPMQWQPVVAQAAVAGGEANGTHTGLLKWAVERVGIPGAILGVVLYLFAGYHRDTRDDRRVVAAENKAQLMLVLEAHAKDREIIRQALDRMNVLLERQEQRDGRGRERERSGRRER